MLRKFIPHSPALFLILLISPVTDTFSQSTKKAGEGEKLEMSIDTGNDVLPFDKIAYQKAYTMDEREGRGIVTSFLINKGVQGIQSLINNRRKKYAADYSFAIRNESFYDQVSTEGPFDPTGIRFKGFTIARIQKDANNRGDTVFVARFSIDTSGGKITDILNNGIFKLKLDSFAIKSSRVRLPRIQKR